MPYSGSPPATQQPVVSMQVSTAGRDGLLRAALAYAAAGWPVFPIPPSTKKPYRGTHGFKDATTDPEKVKELWQGREDANIGLATAHIVVLDADGREGIHSFQSLGAGPATRVARTPRGGLHFYYRVPEGGEVRSWNAPRAVKGGPGLDVKGAGGYVLLPPSRTSAGAYQWLRSGPLAELSGAQLEYALRGGRANVSRETKVPPHLDALTAQGGDMATHAAERLEHTAHNEARVAGALKAINDRAKLDRDTWRNIGFALHQLEWKQPGGTDVGFILFDQWCSRFSSDYNKDGLEKFWNSCGNYTGPRIHIGSVFHVAGEHGWQGEPGEGVTDFRSAGLGGNKQNTGGGQGGGAGSGGFNGVPVGAPVFPQTDKTGNPRATCVNAGVAIGALGIDCRKDLFHERLLVGGHTIEAWGPDLSDDAVMMLRRLIWDQFRFDPGERNTRDAAVQLCLIHQFNPVADYLAGLKWDGRCRIDGWAHNYLGASPGELTAMFGRLMLIAAVRRARHPGTKFDQIVVLEGPQGVGKSSALKILAGEENFSDQHVLGASDKEQQEAFRGVWIHEIAELAGMRRTDVERIKQFARRTEDRARPAYGRIRVDMKRRGIFCATTNDDTYLKEWDRAFWPIKTNGVDLSGLERDRDQLWAEAAREEAAGASVDLPEEMWADAEAIQRARVEQDEWTESVKTAVGGRGDISIAEILTGTVFDFKLSEVTQISQTRVARILKNIGYERYRRRDDHELTWRYRKK